MSSQHQLVKAWAAGWAHSRGTPRPEARPYGFELQVGLPGHLRRHILPSFDAGHIEALTRRITEPGIFLKVCVAADHLAKHLPSGWEVSSVNSLMSTTLTETPAYAAPPEGVEVSLAPRSGAVLSVTVKAAGVLAASGRVGLHGAHAVFDQIETAAAFQRRGFGRLVMRHLCIAARECGASQGVLAATEEGRALYASLGWREVSPLSTAGYQPP